MSMATPLRVTRPRRVPPYYTVDDLDELNDDRRRDGTKCELVYGELLVNPPPHPWHEALVDRLHDALRAYMRSEPAAGYVSRGQPKLTFGRRDTYVMPDIWAVPVAEWRELDWLKLTRLLLAVEVLSPSSRRSDRHTKRRLYQDRGVPLYWIIDGRAHQVEVWRPGDEFPQVETEHLVWTPEGAAAPFSYAVAELFAPV